jgi:hypothetical protein
MADDESVLFVPLRSNASTLVTGGPIVSFRRRLKYASAVYGRLLLEGGVLRLNAGPAMSFGVVEPYNPQDPPRWQTPAQRGAASRVPFQIAVGRETTPGVPAPVMHAMGSSESTIAWVATLYPFADELPPEADWVEFVTTSDPAGSVAQMADRWRWADQRNPALEQIVPVRFVRDTVIKNVNRDLALGIASGFTVAIDAFHHRVVAQRFSDEAGWALRGFAVPVLFPDVGDWSWEAIADLRRDRNMVSFRKMLTEVEAEALADAEGGDLERAAHRAYERFSERANPVESIAAPVKRTVTGLLVSGGAGAAALPIAGLGGLLAGTAIGAVAGGVLDAREFMRRRRSQGWAAISARITAAG